MTPSASTDSLGPDELVRYDRHLLLPGVGTEGQLRLKRAKVLVLGAGGLGAPAAMYLAAAGVGTLGLMDFDAVDASNLQRQILHATADVGRPKVESGSERLRGINPHVVVRTHPERLTSANALDIIGAYDLVVDGTDNFPTRYLVNDACVLAGKPLVYASILRFEGQTSVFGAKGGPCYRCLFPEPPPPHLVPSCAEGGVFGALPGILGSIQASEAIKLLVGLGSSLSGRLLLFDALAMKFRELALERNPACPACGDAPTITRLIDYEVFCGLGPTAASNAGEITATELKRLLDRGAVQLLDVREPHEHAAGRIPQAKLVPSAQVLDRRNELDPSRPAILHCKGGGRSSRAIAALKAAGYSGELLNLTGGIGAWKKEVDGSVNVV